MHFPLQRTCILTTPYGNSTNGNGIKFTIGLQLCVKILSAKPFTGQLFTPSRRCPDGVINDTDYSASCTLSGRHYAQAYLCLGSLLTPRPFQSIKFGGAHRNGQQTRQRGAQF